MLPRIFLFALFTFLAHSTPSIIDSLTIQIPSESDDKKLHLLKPKPLYFGSQRQPPISSSTSTTTTLASLTEDSTTTTDELKSPIISNTPNDKLNQSEKSMPNPKCPGIVCYTVATANGSTFFDCTKALPQNAIITHELECNYWQPPSTSLIPVTAKFFTTGPKSITNSVNQAATLRIVLRPRTENPNLRITADSMVPGALTRLVEAIKQYVRPLSRTPIKLSLIMLKIRRLVFGDLVDIFRIVNVGGLILWNPDYLEETSFLQNADKVSQFKENYVRLTFYCESENDFPAFGRLWLPWFRWQVKFLQCRGHYTCYRWPREERLCCNVDRCPETPGYVITHADKLAKRHSSTSQVHQQQVLDFYSCETESDLTDPLVDLRRQDNCWSIPGYGMIDTTPQPINPSSITSLIPNQQLFDPTQTSTLLVETMKESIIQQSSPIDEIIDHMRMRNLVIGIICLLLLNLITIVCFIIICCWAWRKFGTRNGSVLSTGISGTYEKQEFYPCYANEIWWPRGHGYDYSGSEMAPTPSFARSGVVSSYEQTPVMGSRDALLPASLTPASLRSANGRTPNGRRTLLARSGHPHTIVLEGDADASFNPSQIFPHRQFV